jgi:hypothetical protein
MMAEHSLPDVGGDNFEKLRDFVKHNFYEI